MTRNRNVPLTLLSTVLMAMALLPIGAGAASPHGVVAATLKCGMWNIVPSPNPGGAPALSGVAAISASDVWAVGSTTNSQKNAQQTLIEHWNGTHWQVVTSPNLGTGNNALTSISVVSPSNIWAVGTSTSSAGITQTLTERWNGTHWQVVASPNVGTSLNFLNGVAAVSASNVWAVGDATINGTDQTLIEHWNGSSWQVVTSPNPGSSFDSLSGVAAVSAKDIWVVGDYQSGSVPIKTLIEHWNGSIWQVITSPNVGTSTNALNSPAILSAKNIWAVGDFSNSDGISHTLTEHWNGSSWQAVKSPNIGTSLNNVLNSAAGIPASGGIWAVGSAFDFEGGSQTLIEFFC